MECERFGLAFRGSQSQQIDAWRRLLILKVEAELPHSKGSLFLSRMNYYLAIFAAADAFGPHAGKILQRQVYYPPLA